MNFLNIINKYEDEMINDLKGLLEIESTLRENPDSADAPFGEGIRNSLNYVLDLGKRYGFDVKNVDNIAGHIEYGSGDEIVGILCHVDVVPADAAEWEHNPFAGTVTAGRIYGRGAVDDKGPTISVLYALRMLKDLNIVPKKRIRLIIGTDEESGWRGIKRYFQKCEMPCFGFSPDADFPLIYGEKGILRIEINDTLPSEIKVKSGNRYNVVPALAIAEINRPLEKEYLRYLGENGLNGYFDNDTLFLKGKSAHAMAPDLGINAAVKLTNFLVDYTENSLIHFSNDVLTDSRLKKAGLDFYDSEMQDLTCNLGILEINEKGGKACLDLRYPIRWNKDRFLRSFEEKILNYKLSYQVIEDKPVHYIDKDESEIKILHRAYIKYTKDDKTPLKTIGGGTYARALKKGVAFGIVFPGRNDVVHQANEYISIEDLIVATAIYAEAVFQLGYDK